jgi:hypothetical protein
MKGGSLLFALGALLVFSLSNTLPALAQDQPTPEPAPSPAANEITAGTRFLAGLEAAVSTKENKNGDRIQLRTLEPLTTAGGTTLRAGVQIRGHIDKILPAHKTGRARMWLTFDEISTPKGWIPIVAVVSDVPGVHSVRVAYDREGEIETRSSKGQQEAEAAAAGAFVGAAPGVAAHDAKDAALGAAAGAATAFMVTSGLGQELTLEKGTKLEVTLERSLFLNTN